MFKRRTRGANRSQIPLTSSNRGSDIAAPDNTSLLVNRSKKSVSVDAAAAVNNEDEAALLSLLCDDDDDDMLRPSTSVMNSMSQKIQSTPKSKISQQRSTGGNTKENFPSQVVVAEKSKRNTPKRSGSSHSEQPLTYFLKSLKECGASEIDGEGSFTLHDDQAAFSLKLNELLRKDDNLDKFVKSLKDYVNDLGKLKKLVVFTQTSTDCDVARGPVQEPMLRLLLLADCLQTVLLKLLMEKMTQIVNEGEEFHLISAILRQVRCLNRVQNTLLAAELFVLIDISPLDTQREIIFLLPELVGEDEMEDVAAQLVQLLDKGTELTPVIIDSLSTLPLSSSVRSEVRSKVLNYLDKCPSAYLPSLVLFSVSHCQPSDVNQVVAHLREHLPFTMRHYESRQSTQGQRSNKQQMERDSYIRLTMDNLKYSVIASKHLTEAFLKAVAAISTSDSFKPVDLIMLILIHGFAPGRKPTTITLIRNKIRCGVLLGSHVSQVFKIFRVVIAENHKEMLELSSSLLKSFESVVADIAILLYEEIFSGFGPFFMLNVISDVLLHITSGTSVQNALNLLLRLRDSHKKELEEQASSLLSILPKITELNLLQARQLLDVVASLVTSPSQDDNGLADELQIFIRKQISAWQPDVQKKGTIAAVMLVKHASLRDALQHNDSTTDLFQCEILLKLAMGSNGANHLRGGFFYDELAKMMREVDTQSKLLGAWRDRLHSQLREQIFLTDLDYGCDHFPMSLQYAIDNEDTLVFPILALVDVGSNANELAPSLVPSALRVLWSADKDLVRITPMLCASVILPDASVYDKFLSYQPQQQKLIMDCLFLCANYFIECINALSTQKTSEKLVIRLKQLIEVRKLITDHVGLIPEYLPPPAQFHSPVTRPILKKPAEGRRPARGRKRKSNGAEVNTDPNDSHAVDPLPSTSTAAPADAIAQVAQVATSSDVTDLTAYTGIFRHLFCHAHRLLRMELKLNPTKVFKKKKMSDLISCDVSWSYRPEDKPELGPSDVLYLLQDYISKSEQMLRERPPFLAKKPIGFMSENITSSVFLLGSVKLLPKLCSKLDVVSDYCKELLEANDGVWDAPGMFPTESADIKMTFSAILKIIADILSWKPFQSPVNKPILSDALAALASKTPAADTQGFALGASLYFSGHCKVVPLLSGGVCIIRCLQACAPLLPIDQANIVSEHCEELLQRNWYTVTAAADRGAVYNQLIDSLLRTYFNSAEDRLATVYKAAELAAEEVPTLTGKEDTLPSFKALNKTNFPLMFRAICEALVSATSDELNKKKDDDENGLATWAIVTRTLLHLVEIAKVHTSRTNLAALLKRSHAIILLFLNKGLPLMESALRIKSEEVLKVLKCLQATTRFLHSVCCHSKVNSDAVVAAHVPAIRSSCERLTLQVKGMLILNKIPLDLITIAVLKNRDIQGNDILTQTTVSTSDDESELPAEEDYDIPEPDLEVTIGDEPASD